MNPAESRTAALGWNEFLERGVVTGSGWVSGREAAVLVIMLPLFIMGWALAIATIARIVG